MERKKRQTLLTLCAVLGGYAGLRSIAGMLPETLDLVPLDDPAGYLALRAGRTSGAADPFVGIGDFQSAEDRSLKENARATVSKDLCGALFGSDRLQAGQVAIASFSDYYCPFCRVQTQALAALASTRPDLHVTWHELPLLGETSTLAARAALAADRQGAYVAFHERLMRSRFVPGPEYLTVLAQDLGLDAARLRADVESIEVSTALAHSAALAQIFQLAGTPALVVGRVVVMGEVPLSTIERVIEIERDGGWQTVCT